MIARVWRGWAPAATAGDYQRHYESEVSGNLRAVPGFRGARLLRCDDGDEVMFTSITYFASLDDVHGFAGDDCEQAVIEPSARVALSHWDDRVTHHEVTADVGYDERVPHLSALPPPAVGAAQHEGRSGVSWPHWIGPHVGEDHQLASQQSLRAHP